MASPDPDPLDPVRARTPDRTPHQPILVLGGFLIGAEAYGPLVASLERLSAQPVLLVPVSRLDWLLTLFPFGWARLLDRVAPLAAELAARSPSGRITLVGHSSGGILLRLFLAEAPFEGRRYGGRHLADTLVMLGSPHTALKATAMRARVARELPGAFFARADPDPVRYLAVAGSIDLAEPEGQASATARRLAPTAYRNSTGDPADRGDGLVPVESALLESADAVVLEGYTGSAGEEIAVLASDAIAVESVDVEIRGTWDAGLEAGPARCLHGVWRYRTTADVPSGTPWRVVVTARNRAGHAAILSLPDPRDPSAPPAQASTRPPAE